MNLGWYRTISGLLALVPGLAGMKLRHEWYSRTLARCGTGLGVQWLTVLKWPDATVGDDVGIGVHCWIAHADIGSHVIIAPFVRIHGGHGHRTARGVLLVDQPNQEERVRVGDDCWIGDGAIIMADLAPGTVVGAGAVVISPTAPYSIVAGVPAREIAKRE